MRASLARAPRTAAPPPAFLDPRGAGVILGQTADGALASPIVPTATSLFGPRGVGLADAAGPLVIADTGHHRLLLWRTLPRADATPADLVIGQADFSGERRNGGGAVGPATLNMPTGVAIADGVLAVADAWNHRVLIWREIPERSNRPADLVLGQAHFTAAEVNRGRATPQADTLNWCYGVALHRGRLLVADTGNRRVLIWNELPTRNGAPADLVLGQADFTTRDDVRMRWPHGLATDGEQLFVADAGISQVMVWHRWPQTNGAPCDAVLGQDRIDGVDHNRGSYWPTAATLNMPYGLAAGGESLYVADTANSRVLRFASNARTGAAADALAGQDSFADKGENRWRGMQRDSLCWPYGIARSGELLAIADSGNNRILLWPAS